MRFDSDSLERRLFRKLLGATSVDEKLQIYARLQQLSIVDVPLHKRWVAANVCTDSALLGNLVEEEIAEKKWHELSVAERMFLVQRFHGLFCNAGAESAYRSELGNIAPEIGEFLELVSAVELSSLIKSCNAVFGHDFPRSHGERTAAFVVRRELCESLQDYEHRYFEAENRSPLGEYLDSWILNLTASDSVGGGPERGSTVPRVNSLRVFPVDE